MHEAGNCEFIIIFSRNKIDICKYHSYVKLVDVSVNCAVVLANQFRYMPYQLLGMFMHNYMVKSL